MGTNDPLNPQAPPAPTPVQAPSYTPELAKASTYTATPYEVKPQGLVQERLKGIVAEDSPLIQQAARIDAQKANERGLLSSSMAIGSGREAVIGAAMPIATTDANAINTAAMKTADQQNAASQFNAQALTNVGLANQSAANTAKAQQLEGSIQLTNTKMTQDAQLQLAKLDTNTRMALAQMDTKTRSLLQTNQSASNAYVQTITNIANIQANEKLSGEAKRSAIDTQMTLLREQLGVLERTSDQVDLQTQAPQSVLDLNLGDFFQPLWDKGSPVPRAATTSSKLTAPVVPTQPVRVDPSGRRL